MAETIVKPKIQAQPRSLTDDEIQAFEKQQSPRQTSVLQASPRSLTDDEMAAFEKIGAPPPQGPPTKQKISGFENMPYPVSKPLLFGQQNGKIFPDATIQNSQGAIGALKSGFLNAPAFGHRAELSAAASTGSINSPDYIAQRDLLKKQEDQQWDQHKIPYSVGAGLGMLAMTPVLPEIGAVKGLKALSGAAEFTGMPALAKTLGSKVATGLAHLGETAVYSTLFGGLQNPGTKPGEVEGLQLAERKENAISAFKASPYAAVGGALITKAIESLPYAAQKVKDFAGDIARRAFGGTSKQLQGLEEKGLLSKIGPTALKTKVIGGMPTSAQGLADRAEEALDSKGKEIGNMIDQIDQASQPRGLVPTGQALPQAGVDKKTVVDFLKQELLANEKVGGMGAQNKQMNRLIQDFSDKNADIIPIKEAHELKGDVGDLINWKRLKQDDVPVKEQFHRALYHALNSGVESAADVASSQLGPDTLAKWKSLKQDYAALKAASMLADNAAGRELANRHYSLTDYLATLGAVGRHGPGGLIMAPIHHGLRVYGNQVSAPLIQGLGNKMEQMTPAIQTMAGQNPSRGLALSREQKKRFQKGDQNAPTK